MVDEQALVEVRSRDAVTGIKNGLNFPRSRPGRFVDRPVPYGGSQLYLSSEKRRVLFVRQLKPFLSR
jgi:hypothetical protein